MTEERTFMTRHGPIRLAVEVQLDQWKNGTYRSWIPIGKGEYTMLHVIAGEANFDPKTLTEDRLNAMASIAFDCAFDERTKKNTL